MEILYCFIISFVGFILLTYLANKLKNENKKTTNPFNIRSVHGSVHGAKSQFRSLPR